MKTIEKIALLVIVNSQLLVVRKRGTNTWILPGGKPENGEYPRETLVREIKEELNVEIAEQPYVRLFGTFFDEAAHDGNKRVKIVAYFGQLADAPRPSNEIEECAWIDASTDLKLAPSIRNQIIPTLQRLKSL